MTATNWQQLAATTDLKARNFINGRYTGHLGDSPIAKQSPRDGSLLYEISMGTAEEINQAVTSARQAFNDGRWRNLSAQQRKEVLQKLADLIEDNKAKFALYECLDVGKPITTALADDIPESLTHLRNCAESADKLFASCGYNGPNFAYQVRKPLGVVGGIIGWNYPLLLALIKMAPALAMGNSLVLKPSEFSSLSTAYLAALAVEAGVPPGVFNVVHGAGTTVGAALALHPDVNLLTFTGSSATGKKIMIAAGQSNMKRVMLECGGKSPYLVFDDCPADLDAVAASVVAEAFPNQGARCSAGTRLLIQDSIKDKLLPKILHLTKQMTPQDPLDPTTTFGALINEAHMNKVLNYIDSGTEEGAILIQGGNRVRIETGGYYVEPTIFDNVNPQQKIAREEIFGPVLSVFTFRNEEEAINIANDTCFGLAAYAATENIGRIQRLGQQLNAGQLTVVGTPTPVDKDVDIGIEGHRESGFGIEDGPAGLASYSICTTVLIKA